MENVVYLGNSIPNCTPINLNASATHNITFNAKVDVSSFQNGPVYTFGRLIVVYYTGSAEIIISNVEIQSGDWVYENDRAYLNRPRNVTLSSSNFDQPNGGSLYFRYEETNHTFLQQSCIYNITKPKFTISPLSRTISCGDTSIKTFAVSNDNSSPGTLSYNWQVGSGWKRDGSVVTNFNTVTNTVDLTAYTYPPDNVRVTPILGGISNPQLTSVVNFGTFNPSLTITGSASTCTTGTYSVANLPSGVSVTGWITSNSSISSITSNGNQATLTVIGNGVVTIEAAIINSCGQTAIIPKSVVVGKPAIVNHTINGGFGNMSVNDTSILSVNGVVGATQYYWTITPSTTCSAGSGPRFSANNSTTFTTTSTSALIKWNDCIGDYAVVCYAKNSCGQSYIATKWVNVFDSNTNPCRGTAGKLKVVPNPIKDGTVTLYKEAPIDPCNPTAPRMTKFDKTRNDVKIYDLYGKLVYSRFFNSDEMSISDLKLNSGNYIVNVISTSGDTIRQMIIVE